MAQGAVTGYARTKWERTLYHNHPACNRTPHTGPSSSLGRTRTNQASSPGRPKCQPVRRGRVREPVVYPLLARQAILGGRTVSYQRQGIIIVCRCPRSAGRSVAIDRNKGASTAEHSQRFFACDACSYGLLGRKPTTTSTTSSRLSSEHQSNRARRHTRHS